MKPDLLVELTGKIKSVKIAVIGDFCLDAYFFIDNSMSEISVETGLPTYPVKEQSYSLGGAGNLANNIISLEVAEVRAFGVIGNDLFGKEMLRIMNESSIATGSMFTQDKNWSTHVYSKPYMGKDELNRMDFGNFNVLDESTADQLIERLERELKEVDIIVINQQVPSGIHTPYLRKKLSELIARNPEKIFISDIRDKTRSFEGTYLKLNDSEATSYTGISTGTDGAIPYSDASKAAEILFKKRGKPVFVTCGSRGSLAIDSSGITKVPGLMIMGRVDPVGAGDSYLAGVAVSLAAGYDVGTAAETGSFVAGVTVQKLFTTGTASPQELLKIGTDPEFIYEPELAEDIRLAGYIEGTDTEIINRWEGRPAIRHAIFDHDGTISTLREGWEQIMAPVMIKAILGDSYSTADKSVFDRVKKSVDELIDKTTGIQTLAQMDALIGLIRDFGFVPEEEILDIHGYKKIYNGELLEMVRKREKKLRSGELSIDDFTIKNAVPFIERLYQAGIRLYLASGTDQEDVINEARIFGYDHLFEGGIYGAVGDLSKEAKKMVLENILNTIGAANYSQIITFGDGPVEIRETRKKGGLTVGMATDEIKRFGLNEKKRTRLVKAGADIIISDFAQMEKVLDLLNIK
jgi:rfaE bifunctional protein kinase chain/domain